MKVLVTGGGGFIGTHLVDALLSNGHEVSVLDSLIEQVHGVGVSRPRYLDDRATFVRGDICDRDDVSNALEGAEMVYHLASLTGVGQSMYEIARYVETNVYGTAVLLDAIASQESRSLSRIILASSRAVYGEGAYKCLVDNTVYPSARSVAKLGCRQWEPSCPACGGLATPAPTGETAPIVPSSVYASSKAMQEHLCERFARTRDLDLIVLRFFNVYGPRQALRNPYTGVLGAFLSAVRQGRSADVYEDGLESRDFVHVTDVVAAGLLAADCGVSGHQVFNVGSGDQISLLEIAEKVTKVLGFEAKPVISGKYRIGDIRHCFADLSSVKARLGYRPQVALEHGLREWVEWALMEDEEVATPGQEAEEELAARGFLGRADRVHGDR